MTTGSHIHAGHVNEMLIDTGWVKIKHTYTYSPHQYGTTEISWNTLYDSALLTESKLQRYLWSYAVNTAAYVQQKMFCSAYKW